ncbi:MAG: nicotinamide riboside transporter PnuC [Lachnospiraceae bacterium]|nr:nicotinamide riboside transporter PnuC [Lachnospiraceae bacterium]
MIEAFKRLKWYEFTLWITSVILITAVFIIFKNREILTLIASLVGVTALIFVAKGDVLGQILTVVFAIIYGVVSYKFRYYGEIITYLGMTGPIALMSVITWLRNPFKKGEVKVRHMTGKLWLLTGGLTVIVTVIFYFILRALDTPNIVPSTISIATSFVASFLTMLRSSYYGIGYAANDIVLIVLWVLATREDFNYMPMVICFTLFLINDTYGFFNWQRIKNSQEKKREM